MIWSIEVVLSCCRGNGLTSITLSPVPLSLYLVEHPLFYTMPWVLCIHSVIFLMYIRNDTAQKGNNLICGSACLHNRHTQNKWCMNIFMKKDMTAYSV